MLARRFHLLLQQGDVLVSLLLPPTVFLYFFQIAGNLYLRSGAGLDFIFVLFTGEDAVVFLRLMLEHTK